MAGGRDPWRGADEPYDPYRQQRYPGGAAERAPRGDRAPRRGPGAPAASDGRGASGTPGGNGADGGFDSRSVFIGPADEDPRPAHRRSPDRDRGRAAPADRDRDVDPGRGRGRGGYGDRGGAYGSPPPDDGRGRHARRPAQAADPGRRRGGSGRGAGGDGAGTGYADFARGAGGYGAGSGAPGGAGAGAAALGAARGRRSTDDGFGAGGTAVVTPPGSHSVFDDPPVEPAAHGAGFGPRPGLDPGLDVADPDDRPRRRTWRQRVLLGVGAVVVVVCLAGALGALWVLRTYNSINRVDGLQLNQVAAGEPRNYLVVGSDFREGEVADKRSDSIMIIRVDPKSSEAMALSFPRDLQVEIAGTGRTRKINSAYNGDEGIQRLIDTLQENFAIPIHHYVEIDFAGFMGLVDHIGGIPMYFDMAVRNPPGEHDVGLNITTLGCINVDSEQALALARSRELQYRTPEGWRTDPYGDYGRMTRQQIIIRQTIKKAVQQAKSNPVQLTSMAELLADTVTLDASLGIDDLLDLADQFKNFDPNALRTYSLPIYTKDAEGKGDPWPDLVKAEPILNGFRGLPPDEVGPPLVELHVVNGSGQEGQAANVAGAFQKLGFDVQEPTTADGTVAQTTIYHAPGQEAYGRRVARHLSVPAVIQPKEGLGANEVELVTGPDFENIWEQPIPSEDLQVAAPATAPAGQSGDTATPPTTAAPATTAPPAADATTTTTEPAPPPSTEQVGYTAGQPPPGVNCG